MQSQAKLLLMDQSKLTGSPTVHHKQEILHMLYPPHTHIAANYWSFVTPLATVRGSTILSTSRHETPLASTETKELRFERTPQLWVGFPVCCSGYLLVHFIHVFLRLSWLLVIYCWLSSGEKKYCFLCVEELFASASFFNSVQQHTSASVIPYWNYITADYIILVLCACTILRIVSFCVYVHDIRVRTFVHACLGWV